MKYSPGNSSRIAALLLALCWVLTAGNAEAEAGGPKPALKALSADGQMVMSPSDRCPVCAMFPARRPDSAAAMTLTSGETFYFCSNGCLLRTWLRPGAYLGRDRSEIDRLVVWDYFSGRPIDARNAVWVAGSDVIGPMGPAIVALEDSGQLDTFNRRHHGKTVFRFDQLNDDLWRRISTRDLPPAGSE
ncbi:nitrous oxide reductase accessory protein NosL [Desulfosarcina ovata]|uniref:Nitrous oxide reductase accessory protein NosL n=1 Tax=Desulfosarcina ovata subsp. ovata TaxID=2752305 RepID=A0A5K8AFR6_9BACT|nr:nitrous oxide reductase accessory protein NosL [Desulfosarcina ovata]BBO91441.1 nitrous oxide reductase accessory protein NosL [Desulfosarcina ovata subsp. ovata]